MRSALSRRRGSSAPAVLTGDGRRHSADALVLATGAGAIGLGPLGPATAGVHRLRTLDDALRLRADGLGGRRVIVVGAGFIGLEAAATASALGAAAVTLLSFESHPLADRFGADVGAALAALHRRHGVELRGGVAVAGTVTGPDGRVAGVRLESGEIVDGDLVIVGVGVRPATDWLLDSPAASAAGLALAPDGAVLCDQAGRTGAAGVWALGDCSRWSCAQTGLRRSGHWQDALDQAAVVSADLLGRAVPTLGLPYCWSDQYDVRLQSAGHLVGGETAHVQAGSVDGADLLVTYERDGVETAVLGMNRPRDVMRWRRARSPRTRVPA